MFLSLSASALAHAPAQEIGFDHLSVEEGLSQDIVTAIVQDHQGFLWFGTEDGLNRYDGYSVRVYKHDPFDSTSIASSWVTALLVDGDGTLWVGGYSGLDRYDADRDLFIRVPHLRTDTDSIGWGLVTSLCVGDDSLLWVGTSSGLNRYNRRSGEVSCYSYDTARQGGLTSDSVTALCQDAGGELWVGTVNGLHRFDRTHQTFQYYPETAGSSVRYAVRGIPAIFEDSRRNLWVVQSSVGLFRFDPTRARITKYRGWPSASAKLRDRRIFSIAEDRGGRLWFATFTGLEIYEYATDNFHSVRRHPVPGRSLRSERIYCLYRDKADAIWVGTWQGGVHRYDQNRPSFDIIRHNPGDPSGLGPGPVLSILEDHEGCIWIGTGGGGLNRYDPATGRCKRYLHDHSDPRSLSSNFVSALAEDPTGDLWVGCTEDGTLDRFDRKRGQCRHYPLTNVQSLFRDSGGKIWAGLAFGGLVQVDHRTNRLVSYGSGRNDTSGFRGTGVRTIFEDHTKALWVGTWQDDACLNRLDRATGRFSHFFPNPDNPRSLSSHDVRSIQEDAEGKLWLGTWGGGVNRLDPQTGTFTHLMERDGLANNFVKGILIDSHGMIWISTDQGLSRLDPRTKAFRNFTPDDGLQGYRFLSGSCARSKQGRFYFGGENGVNVFFPEAIKDNPVIPPVVITRFTIYDRPVRLPHALWNTKEVHLEYNEAFFAFEFVALNYATPARNRYAYMMEGFDRDWVQSGSRRYAAYTHLEPGIYVFRVRGSNNHGVWNLAGTSLRVVVEPPFWRTWWFLSLLLAVISMALYGIYRYRVGKLIEIERLRTRIAADLHDELASSLTSIAMFSKIIQDALQRQEPVTPQHSALLDRITSLSRESVSAIRDIIWAIDPRRETLEQLLQRLNDTMVTECLAMNIVLRIDVTPEGGIPTANLLPQQRRDLWLILKEAIHNAVKHSGCSEIVVATQYASPWLVLTIRDDGRGVAEPPRSQGRGLGTMRMRAERLGGLLAIEVQEPRGTSVRLRLRL